MTKSIVIFPRFQYFESFFLLNKMPLRAFKSLVSKKSLRTLREKYTILK